jgi:Family of unknown function (DUF6459)
MSAALTDPATAAARPITVRPAPRREPPFDDELPEQHLRLVGPHDRPLPFAPSQRRLTDKCDVFAARPTGRGDLPDPRWFGRRLLIAALEALGGRRSPQQLAPHLSHAVLSGMLTSPHRATWAQQAALRSLRVCEPADGIAEISAVVQVGPRFRAVAARLEGLDGRWRCVRLQLG